MKRRLKRIWRVIENSELDISNAASHIGKHRERQEQLEIVADEARVLLAELRQPAAPQMRRPYRGANQLRNAANIRSAAAFTKTGRPCQAS